MDQDLLDVIEYVLDRENHHRDQYVDAFGENSDIVQNHIATKALRILADLEPVADDASRSNGPWQGAQHDPD